MKKCGNASTQTASQPINELVNEINPSSIDSMNSDVPRNEDLKCQSFSMRGYLADMRNTNPRACIPFNCINENTWKKQQGSLDVPRYRWWRCKACTGEVAISGVAVDKRSNELADSIKSLSIDSRTSDVNCQHFSMRGYVAEKRNADPKVCIPLDGITENRWEQLQGSLDVPQFRWWRCRSCVSELITSGTTTQDSSLELRVDGGSLKKNDTRPPAKDINMVESIGEREIPYTVSLELLASAAAEMTSDQPQLVLETTQTSNGEMDTSIEQNTSGRPSSSKGNNIHSEVQGQEFVGAHGSRKAKRSCPLLPDANPISSKHAKATGSFSQPLLSRK